MSIFKRIIKNKYKQAINYKIAHPEQVVLCPKCKKPLDYFPMGNAADVICPSRRCIRGDSRGFYNFNN